MHEEKISPSSSWVPETRFGNWFLSTNVWFRYVLTEAVANFQELLAGRKKKTKVLLDVGCGQGLSLSLLEKVFNPELLIAVDINKSHVKKAQLAAAKLSCETAVSVASAENLDLADGSVDVIFCHQLIHHVVNQEVVLRELKRVLAPDGVLLVSESCKPFIDVWTVRWFFRHPLQVQKNADEYMNLIRAQGFTFDESSVRLSTPWWSLADLGLLNRLGWVKTKVRKVSEETELLLVASH